MPRSIEAADHLGQHLAVFGGFLDIAAAVENQLLHQPSFDMAMVYLNDTVLMGYPAFVSTGAMALVAVEFLLASCDVEGVAAVTIVLVADKRLVLG